MDVGVNTVKGFWAMADLAIADQLGFIRIPIRLIGVCGVTLVALKGDVTLKIHMMGVKITVDRLAVLIESYKTAHSIIVVIGGGVPGIIGVPCG
jgi:hypothetical protein